MQGRGRQAPTSTAALPRVTGGRLDALRLSRRAKRGDRGAFEEIFRRHHQELYRYCLAIVGDRHDAEDALQATMAAALRSLPGEERDVDIRSWLFRVAHNESVSMLRRRRATDEADEDLVDAAGASQEAELATRERLRSLVADLGELPDRQRSAIVMRELTGLNYREIGTALTCSEGAARQAVYEARTALREREEGRDMECEHVRRAISDRDGRRLRGRKIKAHLAGCDGCAGFAASIARRRSDLRALFPPLPAAAAGAMLSGLVGGGSGAAVGGGAAGAAAAGGGLAVSAAVKGGSIAAAIAIAAGAADVGGLIDLPNPIGGQVAAEHRDGWRGLRHQGRLDARGERPPSGGRRGCSPELGQRRRRVRPGPRAGQRVGRRQLRPGRSRRRHRAGRILERRGARRQLVDRPRSDRVEPRRRLLDGSRSDRGRGQLRRGARAHGHRRQLSERPRADRDRGELGRGARPDGLDSGRNRHDRSPPRCGCKGKFVEVGADGSALAPFQPMNRPHDRVRSAVTRR